MNNFQNLCRFLDVPLHLKNEEHAINYLHNLLNRNHLNDCNYDEINYEYLITIEEIFIKDNCCPNEELINLLQQLKHQIADSYILKQQYLKRLL